LSQFGGIGLSRRIWRLNVKKEGFLMIKIAPSILSADFANLEREIRRISAADYVHVDVMDGIFVPNITIGIPVVAAIRKVTELPLDVHLMIDRPVRYVEEFCKAGADLVTVHVEADTGENTRRALELIHGLGKKAGVVVKPKTPAEAALPFLEMCDIILVMTVEPGFGGQRFMEDMMPKLRQLREWIDEKNPSCELEVDGGVDPVTCKTVIASGANVLVAGSAVYKAEDIPGRIQELRG
jgi:ribulose-phosphate 3-epimerase